MSKAASANRAPICAIDFGTSNSAVAVPTPTGVHLARVEGDATLIPTAIFYDVEPRDDGRPQLQTLFGRAAMAAYVAGHDGRLMRSMKSVLGSSLMDSRTDIGGGHVRSYADVVGDFMRHLKNSAQAQFGCTFTRAVIGRPVFFVDDDPVRDARAQATLQAVAQRVGFDEVSFQYEPLAAAHDLEQSLIAQGHGETLVLIGDFGGGTCDFTVARLGGTDRAVIAHHGVHVAGTDFDRRVSLSAIMPSLGLGGQTPQGREVPSATYHDLATWHLINTCYAPQRLAEVRQMRAMYADVAAHARLIAVLQQRSGHALAAMAETAKVAVSQHGHAALDMRHLQAELEARFDLAAMQTALSGDLHAIQAAGLEAVRRAGLAPTDIQTVYFTGGSSQLGLLRDVILRSMPKALAVYGDSFASVAKGLGLLAGAASAH